MNCRRFQLITLLFVLFAVFTGSSKAFCTGSSVKACNKTSISLKTGHTNYWYVISSGESVQILAPQQHRTVHFVKSLSIAALSFVICLKCFNFFTGTGKNEHALFQKLLLFPFHAFW
jgi:hypothetical protein